jgi:hypothetical protein
MLPPPKHDFQYRALGLLKGVIKPVQNSYAQGILITEDRFEYPVTPGRAPLLKKFRHCLESQQPYWFYVQPQPRPGNLLGLSVVKVLALPDDFEAGSEDFDFSPAPDTIEEEFQLRGIIEPGDGVISVTVKRKGHGNKHFPPLILKVEGFLPGSNAGEFWDLQVERDGHHLLLIDGQCLLPQVA